MEQEHNGCKSKYVTGSQMTETISQFCHGICLPTILKHSIQSIWPQNTFSVLYVTISPQES